MKTQLARVKLIHSISTNVFSRDRKGKEGGKTGQDEDEGDGGGKVTIR